VSAGVVARTANRAGDRHRAGEGGPSGRSGLASTPRARGGSLLAWDARSTSCSPSSPGPTPEPSSGSPSASSPTSAVATSSTPPITAISQLDPRLAGPPRPCRRRQSSACLRARFRFPPWQERVGLDDPGISSTDRRNQAFFVFLGAGASVGAAAGLGLGLYQTRPLAPGEATPAAATPPAVRRAASALAVGYLAVVVARAIAPVLGGQDGGGLALVLALSLAIPGALILVVTVSFLGTRRPGGRPNAAR